MARRITEEEVLEALVNCPAFEGVDWPAVPRKNSERMNFELPYGQYEKAMLVSGLMVSPTTIRQKWKALEALGYIYGVRGTSRSREVARVNVAMVKMAIPALMGLGYAPPKVSPLGVYGRV